MNRFDFKLAPRRIIAVLAILVLGASLAACGSGSKASNGDGSGPTKLVVSVPYAGLEVFSQVYLAEHFGIFKKNGLDVEIKVVPTADMVALIQRGQIDVAAAGLSAGVFNAIDSGADLQYIAGGPEYPEASKQGYWLRKGLVPAGGIEQFDACSLKGKLVSPGGAGVAGAAIMPLAKYLEKCDLKVSDLRISPLAGADAAAALKAGALDLGQLSDPVWSDPDRKGYAQLLIPYGTAQQTGFLTGKLPSKNPKAAEAFVRSVAEAGAKYLQGDYHNNPEVREALIEELGVDGDTLDASLPLVFRTDGEFDASEFLETLQEVWIEIGDILNYDEPLPDDRIIDNSFADKVGEVS